MSFLIFIAISFPINMGSSKDKTSRERKQEGKRIPPGGATPPGPTSQRTKRTENFVTFQSSLSK